MKSIQAGKLINFTEKEYSAALSGVSALINRLTKVVRSLNPQDPDRKMIESKVDEMSRLRGQLQKSYEGLGDVNV
jgi:hypothetical protein